MMAVPERERLIVPFSASLLRMVSVPEIVPSVVGLKVSVIS